MTIPYTLEKNKHFDKPNIPLLSAFTAEISTNRFGDQQNFFCFVKVICQADMCQTLPSCEDWGSTDLVVQQPEFSTVGWLHERVMTVLLFVLHLDQ